MVEPVWSMKANWREVPPDWPPGFWWNYIQDVQEFLEVDRLTAQVMVWKEATGEYPEDVSTWWPVRMARRQGINPPSEEVVPATIDGDKVLHCGFCGARWSYPHIDRCKLCDRVFGEVTEWNSSVKPVGGSGASRSRSNAQSVGTRQVISK